MQLIKLRFFYFIEFLFKYGYNSLYCSFIFLKKYCFKCNTNAHVPNWYGNINVINANLVKNQYKQQTIIYHMFNGIE